jgi:hypothetical protein
MSDPNIGFNYSKVQEMHLGRKVAKFDDLKDAKDFASINKGAELINKEKDGYAVYEINQVPVGQDPKGTSAQNVNINNVQASSTLSLPFTSADKYTINEKGMEKAGIKNPIFSFADQDKAVAPHDENYNPLPKPLATMSNKVADQAYNNLNVAEKFSAVSTANFSKDKFIELSADYEPEIRKSVSQNPKLPNDLAKKLLDNTELFRYVIHGIRLRPEGADFDKFLKELSVDENPTVRRAAIYISKSPEFLAEIVKNLAQFTDNTGIKSAIANNEFTSLESMEGLLPAHNAQYRILTENTAEDLKIRVLNLPDKNSFFPGQDKIIEETGEDKITADMGKVILAQTHNPSSSIKLANIILDKAEKLYKNQDINAISSDILDNKNLNDDLVNRVMDLLKGNPHYTFVAKLISKLDKNTIDKFIDKNIIGITNYNDGWNQVSNEVDMINRLIARPGITTKNMEKLYAKYQVSLTENHGEDIYLGKLLLREDVSTPLILEISNKPSMPEAYKSISLNKNSPAQALANLIKNTKDNEIVTNIINHKNVTPEILKSIIGDKDHFSKEIRKLAKAKLDC